MFYRCSHIGPAVVTTLKHRHTPIATAYIQAPIRAFTVLLVVTKDLAYSG